MDANSLSILRFKQQVSKFSGIISADFSKPMVRFMSEMLYGIMASKDVKLSNIGRSLQEPIPLIKTEDRLSRNLSKVDFSEDLMDSLLPLASRKVTKDMVIAIDPGDIMKPYAKCMENLCNIYDASVGEPATGYHLCQVTAANLAHTDIVPLYCEGFSNKEEGFTGKTDRLMKIIEKVQTHIGHKGIWAIDREGDNDQVISYFNKMGLDFVTRLKLNRELRLRKNEGNFVITKAHAIEQHVKFDYSSILTKIEDGKESQLKVEFGMVTAALNYDQDEWHRLVVIKGFAQKPMLLLTNLDPSLQGEEIWRIVDIYLTRWKCDECYRYIKQSYNLEDIRVRSYNSVRNLIALVHAVAYFSCAFLTLNGKLTIMVNRIFILSKRLFGVPSFSHYAMADGICELLKKTKTGIINYLGRTGRNRTELQFALIPPDV